MSFTRHEWLNPLKYINKLENDIHVLHLKTETLKELSLIPMNRRKTLWAALKYNFESDGTVNE